AVERALGVAEVGAHHVALNVADALVSIGQFQFEIPIAPRIAGQTIQVAQPGLDDQLARACGPRQIANRVVDIEYEPVRQPARFQKVLPGNGGLAYGYYDARRQARCRQTTGQNQTPLAAQEFPYAITQRIRPRLYRLVCQVAPDIVG